MLEKSILAVLIVGFALQFSASAERIDFVSRIEASPEAARAMGLHKLTAEEKAQLNLLFNAAYQVGYDAGQGGEGETEPSTEEGADQATPKRPPAPGSAYKAFRSNVESDDGDLLILENGAVVEVSGAYLGYIGYRKEAILLAGSGTCKIWIEGKRLYVCELVRSPTFDRAIRIEEVTVSEVKGDGEFLVTLDGRLFEVDTIDIINTSLWLAPFEALLLDDLEVLNLDSGEEPVSVRRLN